MLVEEPMIHSMFTSTVLKYAFELVVVAAVVLVGLRMKKKKAEAAKAQAVEMN
ncbi:hypothetical protein D3C81_2238740 [compost metagenome]